MSEPSTQTPPAPSPQSSAAPERTFQMAEQSFHKAVQARAAQRSAPDVGAGVIDSRPVQLQAFELAGLSAPASAELTPNPSREQSADVQLREASPATEAWLGRPLGVPAQAEPQTERVQALAAEGTQGPGGKLPHLEAIQAAFGDHDVTGVEAHVGGEGGEAARAMGAEAFAAGNDVAFDGEPTLHTAAHEAAHVVQQRDGVQLKGGVGEVGDAYEAHADSVADAVVRGESAQGLLDRTPAAAGGAATAAPTTQKKASTPVVQASPADTAVQLQGPPPEDGEEDPPSDEEIEEMVREAKTEGETRGDEIVDPETPAEPPVPTDGPETATPQATQEVKAKPDRSGAFAATPPGPDSELASFQSLKGGPLSKWDDEIAWHEYFQGDAGGMMGPGAPLTVDRNALIADALGGGALAGFQSGLKNIALDTLINVASSKIPYLQGFVDIAKIAYDPKAWLEGTAQSTVGNMANGGKMLWEGITSGDPIGALDGLLTILDGINNVIATLSTICWIVAAASFVLSFICPAALPFAGLAASWGSSLGAVSTAFGLFLTLGRALVVGLRILQIKYGDADPATLLQQGERLRTQTQAFTSAVTTQAGHKLRETAQTRLQARGQAQNGTQQQAPQNTSTAQPRTRMERIMNLLNGGMDVKQTARDAMSGVKRSAQGTQAFMGTGQYASTPGGGPRSQQQQVADMEHAGLTVHTSQTARDRWNKKVGGKPGVNRELVANNQAAQQQLKDAADADAAAQAKLRAAQQEAEAARLERERVEGDPNTQQRIDQTRTQHAANQKTLQAAEQSVATQKHVISVLETRRAEMVAQGDTQHLHIVDQHISNAKIELYNRNITESNARLAVANSNLEKVKAEVTLSGAQGRDQHAQSELTKATTTAGTTTTAKTKAELDVKKANHAFSTSDRIGGMTQAASEEARLREDNNRRQWYFDFTAQGPTSLHGHNQAAGVTGSGTDLVLNAGANAMDGLTDEQGQDRPGFLGAWNRTLDGKPMDLQGTSGDRAGAEGYQGQVQARLDALKGSLPAPPTGITSTIDGARATFAELDLESRQIAFQQEVMGSLLEESTQSMTALEAMQQISAANQEAVAQHQTQLDQKVTAQDDLLTTSEKTAAEADEGAASGGATAKSVGGFVSRFLEMLNLVPGRLIGGAGDGAGGIKQVASSAEDQKNKSKDASNTATKGVTEAQRMATETTGALTEADADAQALQGVDAQLSQEQLATLDGQVFLQEGLQSAVERQAVLDAEMERLRVSHGTAVTEGSSWATQHEQIRLEGLTALDGLVTLAGPPGGGHGG